MNFIWVKLQTIHTIFHVDIYDIYVYACICTYLQEYALCTYMDLQEYKNACVYNMY